MAYGTRTKPREDTTPRADDDWPRTPPDDRGSRGGGWSLVALILGVAVVALVAWIVYDAVTEESDGLGIGATVSEITGDPAEFAGETVAVSGEVTGVRGPNAMVIGDEELLIVGAPVPPAVSEGDVLQAIGTVRVVDAEAAEDDFGVELADDVLADFDGRPAVAADEINVDPRAEAGPQNVTLTDLVANAGDLDGATATVRGEVTQILAPGVFVLDELLLVAGADPVTEAEIGSSLQVTGIVHDEFDATAFEEGVGGDLDPTVYADWIGQPALVPTEVVPVD